MQHPSQFYRLLVEETHQTFFVYDLAARQLLYQSPAVSQMFQLPTEAVQGDDLLFFLHPDDRSYVQKSFQKLLKTGSIFPLEFRLQIPEQEEQWVSLNVTLQKNNENGEQLLLGHAEDITAQRHYQDYLKKFSNKKDSVLNILAHDLAGPLGLIRNLSEVLKQELAETNNEDVLHLISLIEKTSKKGVTLIDDFMKQEFLESSQTEVIPRRVDLVAKLKELMEEYQGRRGEMVSKQVRFSSDQPELYVEIDDLKFMQAITNLISNALKFTPDGGEIVLKLQEEEEAVLISLSDNGVGIPEKYHAQLFEKFTTARRPGLKGEQSVGMGMSIVKTIVDWHHGEIWFDSQENVGTTFYIRLPKSTIKKE